MNVKQLSCYFLTVTIQKIYQSISKYENINAAKDFSITGLTLQHIIVIGFYKVKIKMHWNYITETKSLTANVWAHLFLSISFNL